MLKLIRVILGLEVQGFTGGIGRAVGTLRGFLGTVGSVMRAAGGFVNGLVNTLAHLPDAVNTVTDAIERMFGPALSRERQEAVFTSLTGSAEQAADMMDFLREKGLQFGITFDAIAPSAQQVAVALKGMNGEVDPALYEELTMAIMKLSALRPDVPIQKWGIGISNLLAGNAASLALFLDLNVKEMESLSAKTRAFLTEQEQTTEQQLGAVTRLGADAAGSADQGIEALRELLEAIGATDELLETVANTTQGKLDRLKAQWKEFVARVGEELLPILIEALDKLLAWIVDHEEEIEAFLKNIGKEAMEAWNALKNFDWEKLGDDIAAAGQTGKEAWEWLQELNKSLQPLADLLNQIAAFSQNAGKDTGAALGTDQFGPWLLQQLGLSGGGEPTFPALSNDFVSTEPNSSTQPSSSGQSSSSGGRTEVDIKISVDESGNLKPIIQRISQATTMQAFNDVTTQITKLKGQGGASIA